MDTIIQALGNPIEITKHNSHRWNINGHLFCVMPRKSAKGTIFRFNVLDENEVSVRAGCWDTPELIIEAAHRTGAR